MRSELPPLNRDRRVAEGALGSEERRAYLGADRFMATVIGARALQSAFELGLVDHLLAHESLQEGELGRVLALDPRGLELLLGLLSANGVVERHEGGVTLRTDFMAALRWRDLIEAKLEFAGIALADFAQHLSTLVKTPDAFRVSSRLLQLFDYERCFDDSPESYRRTRHWTRFTTQLTRHEAGACLDGGAFGEAQRMLDVGGNSGEFALQACRQHPSLRATVADLPLVCEIGLEHVLGADERARVCFVKLDLRREPLPGGHDLVCFKSMLHDWPEADALSHLRKAVECLQPGGRVLIFERRQAPVGPSLPSFADLPLLLFWGSYREPSVYMDEMRRLGLDEIDSREVELDAPFMRITARKPR